MGQLTLGQALMNPIKSAGVTFAGVPRLIRACHNGLAGNWYFAAVPAHQRMVNSPPGSLNLLPVNAYLCLTKRLLSN